MYLFHLGQTTLNDICHISLIRLSHLWIIVTPVLERISRKGQLKNVQRKKKTNNQKTEISAKSKFSACFPVIIHRETDIICKLKFQLMNFRILRSQIFLHSKNTQLIVACVNILPISLIIQKQKSLLIWKQEEEVLILKS